MSDSDNEICARCQHFKMKDYREHAAVGLGRCMGYDNTFTPLINPFLPWRTKACTRFAKAKDMARRDQWIVKQATTQEKV
jgi:hypothetical protein